MTRDKKKRLYRLVRKFALVDVEEKLVSLHDHTGLSAAKMKLLTTMRRLGFTINLTLFPLDIQEEEISDIIADQFKI